MEAASILGLEENPNRCFEKNLLTATIVRAILDLTGPNETERKAARRWVRKLIDDTGEEHFSFIYCCDNLDLNHEELRKALTNPQTLQRLNGKNLDVKFAC